MLIAMTPQMKTIHAEDAIKDSTYFCPSCHHPVFLKKGNLRIPHFAHQQAECLGVSEGETAEHLALKQHFFRWGQQFQQDFQLEKFLPEIQQRPDLLYKKLAVELQCSPLAVERLKVRRAGYHRSSIEDWWLLGKKFQTKQRKSFPKQFIETTEKGNHLWQISLEQKKVTLFTQIEADFTGKLYYQKNLIPFYSLPLSKVYQLPYQHRRKRIKYHERVFWLKNYPLHLKKVLWQRQKKIIRLQGFFYERGLHLSYLDEWYYLPTRYYLFFGDEILRYRYLIEKSAPTISVEALKKAVFADTHFLSAMNQEALLNHLINETLCILRYVRKKI